MHQPHGRAALDWLDSVARSPQWDEIKGIAYGS